MNNKSRNLIISVAGKREHAELSKTIPLMQQLFTAIEQTFTAAGEPLSLYLQTGLADGADMVCRMT